MALDEKYTSHFTLVFEGDIRKLDRNPLFIETPFGKCVGVSLGNALGELMDLEEKVKQLEQET